MRGEEYHTSMKIHQDVIWQICRENFCLLAAAQEIPLTRLILREEREIYCSSCDCFTTHFCV